jgi:hypothetical protein
VGGGYALGVIARTAKKSQSTLFGYFQPETRGDSGALGCRRFTTENTVWACVFGDVGLYGGSWVVLGRLADWDRDAWRMPAFVHRDSLVGLFGLVEYQGERPSRRRR